MKCSVVIRAHNEENTSGAYSRESGGRIPVISEFIGNELARLEESQKEYINNPASFEILDNLFRQALNDANI